MSSDRAFPGQSVTERLFGRLDRRARVGTGSGLFERLGVADPYALDAAGPEAGLPLGADAFSWLSAAAWRAELALAGLRGRMLWRIGVVRHDPSRAHQRWAALDLTTRPMDPGDDPTRWMTLLPPLPEAAGQEHERVGEPRARRWPVASRPPRARAEAPVGRALAAAAAVAAPAHPTAPGAAPVRAVPRGAVERPREARSSGAPSGPLLAALVRAVAAPRARRLQRVLESSPALRALAGALTRSDPAHADATATRVAPRAEARPRRASATAGAPRTHLVAPEVTQAPEEVGEIRAGRRGRAAAPSRGGPSGAPSGSEATRVAAPGPRGSAREARARRSDVAAVERAATGEVPASRPTERVARRALAQARADVGGTGALQRVVARGQGGLSEAGAAAPLSGAATSWLTRVLHGPSRALPTSSPRASRGPAEYALLGPDERALPTSVERASRGPADAASLRPIEAAPARAAERSPARPGERSSARSGGPPVAPAVERAATRPGEPARPVGEARSAPVGAPAAHLGRPAPTARALARATADLPLGLRSLRSESVEAGSARARIRRPDAPDEAFLRPLDAGPEAPAIPGAAPPRAASARGAGDPASRASERARASAADEAPASRPARRPGARAIEAASAEGAARRGAPRGSAEAAAHAQPLDLTRPAAPDATLPVAARARAVDARRPVPGEARTVEAAPVDAAAPRAAAPRAAAPLSRAVERVARGERAVRWSAPGRARALEAGALLTARPEGSGEPASTPRAARGRAERATSAPQAPRGATRAARSVEAPRARGVERPAAGRASASDEALVAPARRARALDLVGDPSRAAEPGAEPRRPRPVEQALERAEAALPAGPSTSPLRRVARPDAARGLGDPARPSVRRGASPRARRADVGAAPAWAWLEPWLERLELDALPPRSGAARRVTRVTSARLDRAPAAHRPGAPDAPAARHAVAGALLRVEVEEGPPHAAPADPRSADRPASASAPRGGLDATASRALPGSRGVARHARGTAADRRAQAIFEVAGPEAAPAQARAGRARRWAPGAGPSRPLLRPGAPHALAGEAAEGVGLDPTAAASGILRSARSGRASAGRVATRGVAEPTVLAGPPDHGPTSAAAWGGRGPASAAHGAPARAGVADPAESAPSRRRLGARSEALIRALARAPRPEEVVRVVVERRSEATTLSRELDAPAARLVRRIAEEGVAPRQGRSASRRKRSVAREILAPSRPHRTPPTGASATAGRQGIGDGRITKLAHKLMGLIHLAESERRVEEAQRHVRMAADTSEARLEAGHGEAAGSPQQAAGRQDYETLRQDVLDRVLRELELNQHRREDPDGRGIWW